MGKNLNLSSGQSRVSATARSGNQCRSALLSIYGLTKRYLNIYVFIPEKWQRILYPHPRSRYFYIFDAKIGHLFPDHQKKNGMRKKVIPFQLLDQQAVRIQQFKVLIYTMNWSK
jgi:hypothetical protein